MIITLTGENYYLLKTKLNELINEFSKNEDLALEKIDCEERDYSQIIDGLHGISLFNPNKLIVLKKPSQNKEFVENFESIIKQIPDETTVIIYESKIDKKTKFYKQLIKLTKFEEQKSLNESQLIEWTNKFVKNESGSITRQNLNYLLDRIGPDQQKISEEIQKLLLYSPNITKKTIDLLTEPESSNTIFEMLDDLFNGQTKKALIIYKSLRDQKVEPQNILGMIAWQLRILAVVKTGKNKTPLEISQEAGLHPYVIQKTKNISNRVLFKDIKYCVQKAHELDITIKTKNIDPDDALTQLLIEISAKFKH